MLGKGGAFMADFAIDFNHKQSDQLFWLQWVGANALAEIFGLGVTAATALLLFPILQPDSSLVAALIVLLVMVSTGIFEGLCVGSLQWSVLSQRVRNITWQDWAKATVIGALIAWVLGMLPSTIMGLVETTGGTVTAEPPALLMYGMAAAMGLLLGPVLGIPQWFVLRRYIPKAGWWIVANALAWAIGMPIIFMGIDMLVAMGPSVVGVAVLRTLLLTGAAVGAVHGLFIVWLTRSYR